jgi:hypothetical protein
MAAALPPPAAAGSFGAKADMTPLHAGTLQNEAQLSLRRNTAALPMMACPPRTDGIREFTAHGRVLAQQQGKAIRQGERFVHV